MAHSVGLRGLFRLKFLQAWISRNADVGRLQFLQRLSSSSPRVSNGIDIRLSGDFKQEAASLCVSSGSDGNFHMRSAFRSSSLTAGLVWRRRRCYSTEPSAIGRKANLIG